MNRMVGYASHDKGGLMTLGGGRECDGDSQGNEKMIEWGGHLVVVADGMMLPDRTTARFFG